MPTRVNEGNRLFREYKRTPLEDEVLKLKYRVQELEAKLSQSNEENEIDASNSENK